MRDSFYFYEDDLKDDPRTSERSGEVVRSWMDSEVHYKQELPPRECVNYYNIVAERLLFRRCILGWDEGADFAIGGDARPFGADGPKLEELQKAGVFICMAFIPLTPDDRNQSPELARLYYVLGLAQKYDSLFETEYERGEEFSESFFVVGLSDNFSRRKIKGDSWRLAARILEGIAQKRDSDKVRNLATNYIVTGDVTSDGLLKPVEMGSKPDLAKNDFKQFKWIMHKENKESMSMDMKNMNKVETPETLEEALELIETMQNKATRSFFRFLEAGDLDGMKEQREIGADWFAADIKTGLMVMPLIGKKVRGSLAETKGMPWTVGKQADKEYPEFKAFREYQKYDAIYKWLKYEGADWAQMFYVLGKLGLDDVLKQCSRSFAPIGVRNEDDFNVLEIALKNRDFKLAEKFYNLGCRCEGEKFKEYASSVLEKCIINTTAQTSEGKAFSSNREFAKRALSCGLDPNIKIRAQPKDQPELKASFFGIVLYAGDFEMIEMCLKANADPNVKIELLEGQYASIGCEEVLTDWSSHPKSGTPMYIANFANKDLKDEERAKIIELLKGYGAQEDKRIDQDKYRKAVRELGTVPGSDGEKIRKCVLGYLDDGEDFNVEKEVIYISADDKGRIERLKTTLWGWAVFNGDIDVMRKCLEHEVPVHSPLKFLHTTSKHIADLQYLNGKTPLEVVLMSEDIPLECQREAIELLKEFGASENDCPPELIDSRHDTEVDKLKSRTDVCAQCYVEEGDIDEYGGTGPMRTTVFGQAVLYVWLDVLERCLELGASVRNKILYFDWCEHGAIVDSGTPMEIIKRNKTLPSWMLNRAKKLLRKYSNE